MAKDHKDRRSHVEDLGCAGGIMTPDTCPSRRLLSIISKKYALDILRVVMINGRLRFTAIVKETGGSPKTITDRLKELCAEGILSRMAFSEIPPRVEYSLTEKGEDLRPLMVRVVEWSERWG